MTTTAPRSVQIGHRAVPVVLPNLRDPRLHTAAVIISVHTIGITALGFEVTVPQIVVAVFTAAIIDVGFTLWRSRQLVWPASGMLTGSGVALILRYVPTGPGDYWGWDGWQWFAIVAGFSILTKHLIRRGENHVFNPSNVGLVVAFLLVANTVIEPLDFWWAPLGPWMVVAYAIIVVGGTLITRRLHLLEMAVTFWLVLVAGVGVLARSGHCMIATWSVTPVCDGRFWATLATSPEVLIFLFFMITDPKTIPRGRAARVTFSAVLAAVATVLMAPNTLEFGTKVALLGSLVLLAPARGLFDRLFSSEAAGTTGVHTIMARLTRADSGTGRVFSRGAALGSSMVLVASLVLIAGTPARDSHGGVKSPGPAGSVASGSTTAPTVDFDPSTLPVVQIDPSVSRVNIDVTAASARAMAVNLAEDLILEAEAVQSGDTELLRWADSGRRLDRTQALIDDAITTGRSQVDVYQFATLTLRSAGESEGQTTAALAFDATGSIRQTEYDSSGNRIDSTTMPLSHTFILRQPLGDRWLIVDVLET